MSHRKVAGNIERFARVVPLWDQMIHTPIVAYELRRKAYHPAPRAVKRTQIGVASTRRLISQFGAAVNSLFDRAPNLQMRLSRTALHSCSLYATMRPCGGACIYSVRAQSTEGVLHENLGSPLRCMIF